MRAMGWIGLMTFALFLAPAGAGEKGKLDPAKLIGTWTYVAGEKDGKKIDPAELKKGSVEISKKTITLKSDGGDFVIKYQLDPAKNPTRINMEIIKGPQGEGSKAVGIIALKGEQLQICYPAMGGAPPPSFATKEGSGLHLFTLKRKK